jgi:hypothetical protein
MRKVLGRRSLCLTCLTCWAWYRDQRLTRARARGSFVGDRLTTSHHKPIRRPVIHLNVGGSRLRRTVALGLDGLTSRPLLTLELREAVWALVAGGLVANGRHAAADLVRVSRDKRPGSRPAASSEPKPDERQHPLSHCQRRHQSATSSQAWRELTRAKWPRPLDRNLKECH